MVQEYFPVETPDAPSARAPSLDARWYQIGALVLMLWFGVVGRDLSISWSAVFSVITASCVVQLVGMFAFRLGWHSFLSAGISALSIVLLCRSNSILVLALVSGLSIASKFVLRWRGKHFFNPSNFGIVIVSMLTEWIWISPAQWGEGAILLAWVAIMGVIVIHRVYRYDISLAFLGCYLLLLALRVAYLGQPWAVFLHQLKSGSLIIFAFFMVSDPRSTPDHRLGRVLFAIAVAILAYTLRFYFYQPAGLLWALFILSPVTILLDRALKSQRFEWHARSVTHDKTNFMVVPSPHPSPS